MTWMLKMRNKFDGENAVNNQHNLEIDELIQKIILLLQVIYEFDVHVM